MPLTGQGIFSTGHAGMAAFLSGVGTPKEGESAFIARNFLLDEGVSAARFASYQRRGAVENHASIEVWRKRHQSYLGTQVQIAGGGLAPRPRLDPQDPAECPETFRDGFAISPFQDMDPRLDLLRVEALDFVAGRSGLTREQLTPLIDAAVAKALTADQRNALDAALSTWRLRTDHRPVFAAFWEDMKDLFEGDAPAEWADRLRDRMGLAHYAPAGGKPFEIIVFRYRVDRLPRTIGTSARPLVSPTVLDGSLTDVFCPAPKGSPTGHTLDLNAESELEVRREVLHPAITPQSDDIFRRGSIRRSFDRELLPLARQRHLEQAREIASRPTYGLGTDGDLP